MSAHELIVNMRRHKESPLKVKTQEIVDTGNDLYRAGKEFKKVAFLMIENNDETARNLAVDVLSTLFKKIPPDLFAKAAKAAIAHFESELSD